MYVTCIDYTNTERDRRTDAEKDRDQGTAMETKEGCDRQAKRDRGKLTHPHPSHCYSPPPHNLLGTMLTPQFRDTVLLGLPHTLVSGPGVGNVF